MYILVSKDCLPIFRELKEFKETGEEENGPYKAGEIVIRKLFKKEILPVFVSPILEKEIQLRDDINMNKTFFEEYTPYMPIVPKELLHENKQ